MRLPLPDKPNQPGEETDRQGIALVSGLAFLSGLAVSWRTAIWQMPLLGLLAWDIGVSLLLFWGAGLLAAQLTMRWQRWYVQLPMLVALVAAAAVTVPVRTADFFILLLAALLPLTWRLQDKDDGSVAPLSPAGLTPTIFLVGAVFLYQIQFAILMLVIVWLLAFLLWYCMALTGFRLDALRVRWVPVIAISTGTAALIVVLFVAVPRVSTGVIPGFTPQQQKIALTDTIEPGGMRDLLADDTIAFRAVPQDDTDVKARYWRVFVLDAESKGRWQRQSGRMVPMASLTRMSPDHSFSLLLDDHDAATLPAPGWPAGFSPDYDYSAAGELITTAQANPRRIDVGGSLLPRHSRPATAPGAMRVSAANPRLVDWARQQRAMLPDDKGFVELLLQRFATEFVYDTSIDLGKGAALDTFFFDQQRGYCSYFATAMATALRAAGIEANVVMGYLGGSWNGYGGFWTVRNADAHAWVEARLDGGGWQRLDPTLVVMAGLSPAAATAPVEPVAMRARQPRGNSLVAQLRAAGQWVDALNTRLTIAIMDYGQDQNMTDDQAGRDNAAFVFIAIALAMIGVAVASILAVLARSRHRQDRQEKRLERLLARIDNASPRKPGETMMAYAGRVSSGLPAALQDQIRDAASMLTRFRYAPHAGISTHVMRAAISDVAQQMRRQRPVDKRRPVRP